MTAPVPMPDNFPSYASERSLRQLSKQFKVSCETVTRWRKDLALVIGTRTPWTPDEDNYLRIHYGTKRFTEIGGHIGRSADAVKKRALKLGIQSARKQGWNLQPRTAGTKIAAGHSGEAAYLQAYGPIYRCYKGGEANPAGNYWYWAGQVLTHDEMEAKATAHRERKALLAVAA